MDRCFLHSKKLIYCWEIFAENKIIRWDSQNICLLARSPAIRKTIEFNFATHSEKLQFQHRPPDLQTRLDCKSTKDVIMKMIMDCNIDSTPTLHAIFIIPSDFMNIRRCF